MTELRIKPICNASGCLEHGDPDNCKKHTCNKCKLLNESVPVTFLVVLLL